MITLEHTNKFDEYTDIAKDFFDLPMEEKTVTQVKDNIKFPNEWQVGLICGSSGSGKSTLLKTFGEPYTHKWDNSKAVISNFTHLTPQEATEVFSAVGFSSVRKWMLPYSCLSTGEKFRVDIAMAITKTESDVIVVDEFTSVVDRTVAKTLSHALQKHIRKTGKKIVLASCHSDIIEWLQPDWVFEPTGGKTSYPRGSLQRPQITLKVCRVKYDAWELFKQYHYLSADLNKSARCFMAYWGEDPVAFCAVIPQPSGYFENGWRISRLVVLPDYQGVGIGGRLTSYVASLIRGCEGESHCFVRLASIALSKYFLNRPNEWKETTHSREVIWKQGGVMAKKYKHDTRVCYAFEYVGEGDPDGMKLFYKTPSDLSNDKEAQFSLTDMFS